MYIPTLKVNSKDNTINIQLPKDSWNREEIYSLCKSAHQSGYSLHAGFPGNKFEDWIKERL